MKNERSNNIFLSGSKKHKQTDLFGNIIEEHRLSLSDKYVQPPFSVLNSQKGDWQRRKRKWLSLGIHSELGRNEKLLGLQAFNESEKYITSAKHNGTSVFDPVLSELMYLWFCPEGGNILDPFAGGSVRGIVANYLGYKYTGIELREQQCISNREKAIKILEVNNQPQWYCGDSEQALNNKWLIEFDFIFTCPPYMNLEVYSDSPEDLSNMSDDCFLDKYENILKKSCFLLKKGGYACLVVGDLRDKEGFYKDFVQLTKQSLKKAGMKLYNELIYIERSYFSAGMRADRYMSSSKKIPKVHQNVLIFKKT